jgi:hypothetical protein
VYAVIHTVAVMGQAPSRDESASIAISEHCYPKSLRVTPARRLRVESTSFEARNYNFGKGDGVVVNMSGGVVSHAIVTGPVEKVQEQLTVPWREPEWDDNTPFDQYLPRPPRTVTRTVLKVPVKWVALGVHLPAEVQAAMDPIPASIDMFYIDGPVELVDVTAITSFFSWRPYCVHAAKLTNFRWVVFKSAFMLEKAHAAFCVQADGDLAPQEEPPKQVSSAPHF